MSENNIENLKEKIENMTTREKIERLRELWHEQYVSKFQFSEKIYNLEQLSGYTIEVLTDMFAAGWTLEPPKSNCNTMADLAKQIDEDHKKNKGEC